MQGWYIVTYGLAIYLLNLFLGFLSPAQDPEMEGGPLLPMKDGEMMFIRRVPEFKFWCVTVLSFFLVSALFICLLSVCFSRVVTYLSNSSCFYITHSHRLSAFKAVALSILLSMFKIFDVPVFWPILLLYFFALFFLTMKRQVNHMRKHGYTPWSKGKKSYKNTGKEKLDKPSGSSI